LPVTLTDDWLAAVLAIDLPPGKQNQLLERLVAYAEIHGDFETDAEFERALDTALRDITQSVA
jgi:hypothetical protein